MKYGISNLKKLLQLGLSFTNHAIEALEDKKISLIEALGFVPDLMALSGVVKSWPAVKQEIADLDAAERQQLRDFVIDQLQVPNENVDQFIEEVSQWAITTLSLIETAKSLKK